jgi:hypothetical protein
MRKMRRKTAGPKEQDIKRAIVKALQARGVWCWVANSGSLPIGGGASKRVVQMSPTGTPDILGVLLPKGRLFGLEVKRNEKCKQSPGQIAWQAQAKKVGVRYAVVWTIGEALALVATWQRFERGTE